MKTLGLNLRKRKQGNGKISLFLDVYHRGKRHTEFLELYLDGDRQHQKEVLALAKSIEAERRLELHTAPHGYLPEFKRKAD